MDQSINSAPQAIASFCPQCGSKGTLNTRFCGNCGVSMDTTEPGASTTTETGVDDVPVDHQPAMPLWQAWAYFVASLVINYQLARFSLASEYVLYLVTGIFMSRYVMRRLIAWHPVYNTLENVFSAKIGMVLFWPLQMFSLLFKLSLSSVL